MHKIIGNPIKLPHFGNLKLLELLFFDGLDKNLLIFTNFIDACPVLQKFKLRVTPCPSLSSCITDLQCCCICTMYV